MFASRDGSVLRRPRVRITRRARGRQFARSRRHVRLLSGECSALVASNVVEAPNHTAADYTGTTARTLIVCFSLTHRMPLQFSAGVVGGTYYWLVYLRHPRLEVPGGSILPRLKYTEGCAGGEPAIVLVGYVMNVLLLLLFVRFYHHAYRQRKSPTAGSSGTKVRRD